MESTNNKVKQNNKKYIKVDPIDHILLRSEMYVGPTSCKKIDEYIANKNESGHFEIEKSEILFSPALLRIFVEPLSNALDNVERSKNTATPCTKIKVNINKTTGETTIWNNGDIIPIEINEQCNCYNHSMIFGQLLTGSNYNDDEERIVSGRNGLGVKLVSVFSTYFKVVGVDPVNQKILTQEWRRNMKDTTGPVVRKSKLTKGYTEISWIPDFSKFGMEQYSEDIIKLYSRYVIDAAMLSKIEVSLNDEIIPVNNILSYSQLYKGKNEEYLTINTPTSSVVITSSTDGFQAISFVNGVYTRLGGQHVDAWSEAIFRPIIIKFNKKGKPSVNITDVKNFFTLFIVSTVVNPEFDGQDKSKLENPQVEAIVKKSHIDTIMKWSVAELIQDIIQSKELLTLKKTERKKKSFIKIEGLDPANNAGTAKSRECSLILCEGLSAKTYAVAGIKKGVYGKSGRDWFGIYPLRGKILNVRNSSIAVISKNSVVTDLIHALGIKHQTDYTVEKNFSQLNYGKIIIMTDSDVDGIHIEGLILNLFHFLFPSLFNRTESFIVSMKTPIVRVFQTRADLLFYDERRFKEYAANQKNNFKKKYYKGLGTTKQEDVPDTFGLKMVEYGNDPSTNENMNKVFHVKYSDDRKNWLANYNGSDQTFSLDDSGEITNMGITNFINHEMIKFSHDDCKRSIPNAIDGLKESQRKILYAVMKKKLKFNGTSLKVAQLGGYVAEHTNYHHGEQNLFETITKMANEFPGSNNIPLLDRDGMFGSRNSGGKDAASPRYIFTKMDALTHLLYREEDSPLLEYNIEDGDSVEPKFYIPILPVILINGCLCGIGTGWSSNIPCYNPLDLIACVKLWLENDGEVFLEDPDNEGQVLDILPDIQPWYRDFTGTIERDSETRYITYGVINREKTNKVVITELPVGMWTDKFKEMCEECVEKKEISSMKNYSTPKKPHFILTESDDGFSCNLTTLKLYTYLSTSNMVLFNDEQQLKKFNKVSEIINTFCRVRLNFYGKRKQYMLKAMGRELRIYENKVRFIGAVISKTIDIMNNEEDVVINQLESENFDKENDSYDYLLKLQIRSFTGNKIRELTNQINTLLEKITLVNETTEKQMWLNEIEEFAEEYRRYLISMNSVK